MQNVRAVDETMQLCQAFEDVSNSHLLHKILFRRKMLHEERKTWRMQNR